MDGLLIVFLDAPEQGKFLTKTPKENEDIWLRNQHHEKWTSKIINDVLQKVKTNLKLIMAAIKYNRATDVKQLFFLQYLGNFSL